MIIEAHQVSIHEEQDGGYTVTALDYGRNADPAIKFKEIGDVQVFFKGGDVYVTCPIKRHKLIVRTVVAETFPNGVCFAQGVVDNGRVRHPNQEELDTMLGVYRTALVRTE
jgi:hypothetical protein